MKDLTKASRVNTGLQVIQRMNEGMIGSSIFSQRRYSSQYWL